MTGPKTSPTPPGMLYRVWDEDGTLEMVGPLHIIAEVYRLNL
jgi:hypothetical protein